MDKNERMNFLAKSIQNAKKVMDVVEDRQTNTQYHQPVYNKKIVTEEDVDNILFGDDNLITENQIPKNNNTMKNLHKSKMPPEILKSFQENPIIDPTAPIGMESMMEEITKKVAPKKQTQNNQPNFINENVNQNSSSIDIKLLEYVIKKTVEETLEQVNKKTTLDENIQIKIGDKIFGGKINALKEIKKNK